MGSSCSHSRAGTFPRCRLQNLLWLRRHSGLNPEAVARTARARQSRHRESCRPLSWEGSARGQRCLEHGGEQSNNLGHVSVLQVMKQSCSTDPPQTLRGWFGHPHPLRDSPCTPLGLGCCTQELWAERWWGKVGSSSVYRNYLKMANVNPPGDLLPAVKLHIGQRLF